MELSSCSDFHLLRKLHFHFDLKFYNPFEFHVWGDQYFCQKYDFLRMSTIMLKEFTETVSDVDGCCWIVDFFSDAATTICVTTLGLPLFVAFVPIWMLLKVFVCHLTAFVPLGSICATWQHLCHLTAFVPLCIAFVPLWMPPEIFVPLDSICATMYSICATMDAGRNICATWQHFCHYV